MRLFPGRPAPLLLFLLAVACDAGGRSGGSTGDIGGTLVVAAPGTGTTPTFPPHAGDAMARLVVDNVYERLAEIGPALNTIGDAGFTPELAQRWEWAADSMAIVFHLDPRARWHDGQPVRAADVRFTLQVLKDPNTATQYTPMVANVDSVSVRDSLTAVVWYRARSPEQFYQAAYQLYVLPEHILKDIPRAQLATSEAAARPVGSGRFRFVRFEPGVRIELMADTTHRFGRPKLDRVILSFTPDPNTGVTQLISEQADFMDVVPPSVLPRLDSATNVRTLPYPGLAYGYLSFNTRDPRRPAAPHPIFADVTVRRALSMAVDRDGMVRNVFGPQGLAANGPFPRSLADSAVKPLPYDRQRAAALLDSAGWRPGRDSVRVKNGRPLAFTIVVPTSSAIRMRYAVLLQEQLRAVGARMDIESMDFGAAHERLQSGRYDAGLNVVQVDPAHSGIGQYWGTAGRPPSGSNIGSYSNRTVDALIDSLSMPASPERLAAHWRRATQMIVDDAPAIWLYELVQVGGAHRRLRIEGLRADGWWVGLPDWWIPAAERIERDRIGLRPAQP